MAEGRPISYNDLIEPGLINQLVKELEEIRKKFTSIGSGSGNVKEANSALKDTVDITEDLLRLQSVEIRLQKEISTLTAKQTRLRKEGKDLTTEQAAQLTKLKETRKQNNRELNNEARLTQQVKGSMNELSQALAKNKIEYRKLTDEERKNIKVGGQLLKTISKQDKEIKKLDKTLGDNQRNVGNYTSSLAGAGSQFGILGTAMMQVTKVFNLVKIGFRSLNAAIASTGIGLLLVAIASLVGWFKKSVAGGEAFQRVMAPLKAIMQVVTNVAVELGGALAKLFTGDFSGAIDQATGAFDDLNGQMDRALDSFDQLAELTILNKKQTGDWAIQQALLNRELQQARLFARDETAALVERIAANKRAMQIEDELATGRADLIKQQIAMIVLNEQAGQSNQDEINQRKLLTAELIQIEADQAQRKVRLITYLTTLQNQYAASLKADIKDQVIDQEVSLDALEEREEKEAGIYEDKKDRYIEDAEAFILAEEAKESAAKIKASKEQQLDQLVYDTKVDLLNNGFALASQLAGDNAQEQKIIATAQALINTYLGATQALATLPPPGSYIAMAATIAAGLINVAAINGISFAEGSENVHDPNAPLGTDTIRANVNRGERILTTEQNRPLLAMGISNKELPGLANMGLSVKNEYPLLASIAMRQLSQQERTNKMLGGWKYVDKHGNEIDLEGNKKIYLS